MKNLTKCSHCWFLALVLLAAVHHLAAQGTAFTYQGQLNTNGLPANGFFDFEFSLFTNAGGTGTKLGSTITQTNLGVTNGLFSTALDFGDVFNGDAIWLSIGVRSNGGSGFTALTPLQELTPTPYAITASNVTGTVSAAQLSGILPLAQLPGAVVTNNDPEVSLVSLTLSGDLTLPSPATIDIGGNSLLLAPGNNNFYAGPSAGISNGSGGANTGLGGGSLQSNTNGTNNTGFGYASLGNNTNGSYNVAIGERALAGNTSGNENTGGGRHVLLANTSGNDNTAFGYEALSSSPNGSNNIALGYQAGNKFTANESSNIDIGNLGVSGDNNIIRLGDNQTATYIAGVINGNGGGLTNLSAAQLASGTIPLAQLPAAVVTNSEPNASLGTLSLSGDLDLPGTATIYSAGNTLLRDDGNENFFAGPGAGNLVLTGAKNTAEGDEALADITSGDFNTANGAFALEKNTSGGANSADGYAALLKNVSGNNNTANGANALALNLIGGNNTAIGFSALENSTNDNELVAVGYQALQNDNAYNNGVTTDGNGHNTAIGYQALQATKAGFGNTGTGYQALLLNTSGYYNTATGDKALYSNTFGIENTANGEDALYNNTSGSQNTAVGQYALLGNRDDNQLVAIGNQALASDDAYNWVSSLGEGSNTISGNGENTAVGYYALGYDTWGYANTAMGYQALAFNDTGGGNTAIGDYALAYSFDSQQVAIGYETLQNDNAQLYTGGVGNVNESGNGENTAIGYRAMVGNTAGYDNTAIGYLALAASTNGSFNTAIGSYALGFNQNGSANTAIGNAALQENSEGGDNTALGQEALTRVNGSENTALGSYALWELDSGSGNIAIGFDAGVNINSGGNNIYIGNEGVSGDNGVIRIGTTNVQTSALIAGIYEETVFVGPTLTVAVDAAGHLGTPGSSERFKQNIRSMDDASDVLLALRPVTFQYKPEQDPQGTPQFGLVAEEVDKVDPDLVARDAKGKVFTVRYDAVNAMLLNEFLKQHRTVEEQSAEIATLKEKAATVDQQSAEIEALEEKSAKVDALEEQLSELKQIVQLLAEKK